MRQRHTFYALRKKGSLSGRFDKRLVVCRMKETLEKRIEDLKPPKIAVREHGLLRDGDGVDGWMG